MANDPIDAISTDKSVVAVHGRAPDSGIGVFGETAGGGNGVQGFAATIGHGVQGNSVSGRGVVGVSQTFFGVSGQSTSGIGVSGESSSAVGVQGISQLSGGVVGISGQGEGVRGLSHNANHGGVVGLSDQPGGTGVFGTCDAGTGVVGVSDHGIAIHGKGGKLAGLFEGDVEVTGDVRLPNADCAEDFDVCGVNQAEPGTVMILGADGALFESQQAYDKRVAGVVSGAGDYKPAIVLDGRKTSRNRQPIALMGKVFCKVDAQFGTIDVGDLLTTSPTPGHAMVAAEPARAFGTVIGKALRPLSSGKGMIPILVALQ